MKEQRLLLFMSLNALNNYAISHAVNAPTDMRISVKTSNVGSGRYAGRVMISYYDNSQYHTASFTMEDQIILRVFQMGIQVKIMLSTISGSPIKAKSFHGFLQIFTVL